MSTDDLRAKVRERDEALALANERAEAIEGAGLASVMKVIRKSCVLVLPRLYHL